jgi:hypothetical protein
MAKYLRYAVGGGLLGICALMVGWVFLLMVTPGLFTNDAESLRLVRLGTIEMLTTFKGFRGLLEMLTLPLVSGICGYLLLKPPRTTIYRIREAYRMAVAQRAIARAWKNRSAPTQSGGKPAFLGRFIMFGGTLLLTHALMMDTSVESGYGRVVNIGLMADRQNELMLGCFAIFVGLILTLFGQRK